jgi:hypothetical protein
MGDIAKGNRTVWGFRHEATYATPLVVGVDHGVVMGSSGEGISHASADIPDDNLEGEHQEFFSEKGSETVAGDLANPPMMFDSVYHMLAHAIGAAAAPVAILQVVVGLNDKLDMTELTSGAFTATLLPGNYTPVQLAAEWETQINLAATDNTYLVDFGVTTTDIMTISLNVGTDNFAALPVTGPNTATSGFPMARITLDTTPALTNIVSEAVVVPASFLHVLTPPALMNAAMGTFVYAQASLYLKEFVSCMFNGFTLDYPNQGKINCALPAVPHGVNFDDSTVVAADKPVNLLSAIGTISRPGNRDTGLWRQTKVAFNAQAGAALVVADRKKCSAMQAVANNNYVADDFTLEFAGVQSQGAEVSRISQPVRDNKVQFTGSLSFSRFQANIRDVIDGMGRVRQKMQYITTALAISGAANTGQRYQINIYMPDVQFDTEQNVGSAGRVPRTINYQAHAALAVPTGFPAGYTDGMTIEVVNSRNINALTQV